MHLPRGWIVGCFLSVFLCFGAQTATAASIGPAPWGLYLYMAANNDLEPYAWLNLAQIAESQPKEIPVIAAIHFKSRKGTYFLDLTRVSAETLTSAQGRQPDYERLLEEATVEVQADRNFSEIQTLNGFLEWANRNYPSVRRSFVYWGHGFGWRGFAQDDSSVSPKHLIRFPEFRRLLETFQARGLGFEWVAFDACSIGLIEVAYELRNVAPYMVASSIEIPYFGYPYHKILGGWVRAWQERQALPEAGAMVADIVREYGLAYSGDALQFPKDNPLEAFKLVAVKPALIAAYADFFKQLSVELMKSGLNSTRWFRELEATISSYDAVADFDALLYYLGQNIPQWATNLETTRNALGFVGQPDSLVRQIYVSNDEESIARVVVRVTPDRYTSEEARRAISAINRNVALQWKHSPKIARRNGYDEISFEIEMFRADHHGLFAARLNPFILGSRQVDIFVTERDSGEEVQHLAYARHSDAEFRFDFPPSSPLFAEAHGAEFPEFRSLGILFTDRLPEESFQSGLSSYQELDWERATGWGSVILAVSQQLKLKK